MKNLLVVTNLWIYLEEYMAVSRLALPGDNYVTVNLNYNAHDTASVSLLENMLAGYFHAEVIPWKEALSLSDWNTIVLPSVFDKDIDKSFGKENYDFVFVEDGTYDYWEMPADWLDIRKRSPMFCFDIAAVKFYYPMMMSLDLDAMLDCIESHIPVNLDLPVDTPVVFTTAPDSRHYTGDDLIKILEELFPKGTKVFIKQHPRDLRNLVSDKLNIVVGLGKQIPGQYIDKYFTGMKIYEDRSTTRFMSKNKSRLISSMRGN